MEGDFALDFTISCPDMRHCNVIRNKAKTYEEVQQVDGHHMLMDDKQLHGDGKQLQADGQQLQADGQQLQADGQQQQAHGQQLQAHGQYLEMEGKQLQVNGHQLPDDRQQVEEAVKSDGVKNIGNRNAEVEDDLDTRSGSAEYTEDGDDTQEIMRIFRPMQGEIILLPSLFPSTLFCYSFCNNY
jgi:hypothetical protein